MAQVKGISKALKLTKSTTIRSCIWYDRKNRLQAYGFQKSNINDVRYEKCCGEKFPKPSKIVPIKDKLHQHIKQGKYEAFVWKNALEAKQ